MKIGFAFYGITHGVDSKTGYQRDFRDCWSNIQENLIDPFVAQGHEAVNYASTYTFNDPDVEKDFWSLVNPKKLIINNMEGSDAFTTKSALHDAFQHEDLDVVIFTRFDILFHQKMTEFPIDFEKVNILFPEDPQWWASHHFVCLFLYLESPIQ